MEPGSYLQGVISAEGSGRGRGHGDYREQLTTSAGYTTADNKMSWNPSWLTTEVSPPSFPGVGRGRGRADLLASMVSIVGSPKHQNVPPPSQHINDQYRDVCEESDDTCSDGEEELLQLRQDHAEWKRQMDFMAQRGQQLEQAIDGFERRRKQREDRKRKALLVPKFPASNNFEVRQVSALNNNNNINNLNNNQKMANRCNKYNSDGNNNNDLHPTNNNFSSPVMCSTQAYDPVCRQDPVEDLSMWLRRPDAVSISCGRNSSLSSGNGRCHGDSANQKVGTGCSVQRGNGAGSLSVLSGAQSVSNAGLSGGVNVDHDVQMMHGYPAHGCSGVAPGADVLLDGRTQSVKVKSDCVGGPNASLCAPVLSDKCVTDGSNVGDKSSFSVEDLKKAWRRECKIKGTIGKIGDKENKLGFIDVERQITTHEANGYTDSEIVDAIINATQAGSTLRTLLQTTVNLDLTTLKDILHSYFLDVGGGDLVTQLTTAKQTPPQDPQTFLMHCINLKNRIAALKEEDGGMSMMGATKVMLNSLETGLMSERIVNRLMPQLSNVRVSDGELLSAMSKAVRAHQGREDKGEKKAEKRDQDRKQVNVKSLENRSQGDNQMMQMVAEIRSDIKGLRNAAGEKKDYGCESCCVAGKGRSCTHCFYCGKTDHRYAECPEKEKKSLNSNRLSMRD